MLHPEDLSLISCSYYIPLALSGLLNSTTISIILLSSLSIPFIYRSSYSQSTVLQTPSPQYSCQTPPTPRIFLPPVYLLNIDDPNFTPNTTHPAYRNHTQYHHDSQSLSLLRTGTPVRVNWCCYTQHLTQRRTRSMYHRSSFAPPE